MNQMPLPFLRDARFDAWQQFHARNPRVYRLFVRFADQFRQRGRRIGARAIGERIRWEIALRTDDPEFKVNNNHWTFYARLLAASDPRFAGFFEFRQRPGIDAPTDDEIIRAARHTNPI